MRRTTVSASGIGARLAFRRSPLPRRTPHAAIAPHIRTHDFHSKSPDNYSEALAPAAKTTAVPAGEVAAEPAPPPPHRVTIAELAERRAKAGRLVAPTAAYSQTDMFKGPSAGKPLSKPWDHHISSEAASREPCVLKQAARHLKTPGILSLGGGLPCAEYFPITSLSMSAPSPPLFTSPSDLTVEKYTATTPPFTSEYDLSIALNYGQANGSAQLNRFVAEHTELICAPPTADWRTCLTIGSTGALEQVFRLLIDRSRNDSLLTEEHSFATALETAIPLGARVFGVPTDDEGLLPSALDAMLSAWDPVARGGARKPHVLYTVPTGQNPTGALQSAQRRREIYALAQKHDLLIVEDEPYYFLQFPAPGVPLVENPEEDISTFLDDLVPPYLTLDVDGRVIRLDSFSKVAVPGARLGWITASAQIIERYERHAEVASQGPSGFSQVLLWRLLDQGWGHEGYLRWLMRLRGRYAKRRDVLVGACEGELPREVVSWGGTRAGMFHWIKVDHTKHPDYPGKSILEMEEEIFDRCIKGGVLVARGSWFRAEPEKPPTGLFFRTTYAAATEENMVEATRRLGKVIREVYKL
ncbi:pyridoxal phosphate-dependent transferase [Podospora conica]|nr:pyridoxal phosphate-dependent transferase [Schizothecium conicum]